MIEFIWLLEESGNDGAVSLREEELFAHDADSIEEEARRFARKNSGGSIAFARTLLQIENCGGAGRCDCGPAETEAAVRNVKTRVINSARIA